MLRVAQRNAEPCKEADYSARIGMSTPPEGGICSLRGRALLQQASKLRPQLGIAGIDGRGVRLVDDLAAAVEDNDVGVVLFLVAHECFQRSFFMYDWDEGGPLTIWHALLHARGDHAADQAGCIFNYRQLVEHKAGVLAKLLGCSLRPGAGGRARGVGEAQHQHRYLARSSVGQHHLLPGQVLLLQSRELLRGGSARKERDCHRKDCKSHLHHVSAATSSAARASSPVPWLRARGGRSSRSGESPPQPPSNGLLPWGRPSAPGPRAATRFRRATQWHSGRRRARSSSCCSRPYQRGLVRSS